MEESAYEQLRKERIERNNKKLKELGIISSIACKSPQLVSKSSGKTIKQLPVLYTRTRRQSKRVLSQISQNSLLNENEEPAQDKVKGHWKEVDEKIEFEPSALYHYCCQKRSTSEIKDDDEKSSVELYNHFHTITERSQFRDLKMKKSYSIAFHPHSHLVASAGHEGRVNVYGIPVEQDKVEVQEPLLSFKAHRGWIAAVDFRLSTPTRNVLLTASNDASVKLWDVAQSSINVKNQTPRELATLDTLHTQGIFSMDVQQNMNNGPTKLLTGSKDGTVVVTTISAALTTEDVQRYTYHSGVVKCVKWSPYRSLFASVGNERVLYCMDIREPPSTTASMQVQTSAHSCLNSVSWHPSKENVVMVSGFDDTIYIHDLRKSTDSLCQLKGHQSERRGSSIYHPTFMANGDHVVTTGCKSSKLFIYDANVGTLLSEGELGFKPTSMKLNHPNGCLAVSGGTSLYLYDGVQK